MSCPDTVLHILIAPESLLSKTEAISGKFGLIFKWYGGYNVLVVYSLYGLGAL
jgi:hypothetical protein